MKFNIWKDCERKPLPEVLSFIVDNRGKTVPVDPEGNHVLIATNCVRNESLYPSYEKIRTLNEETYQNWFRAHPVPGDILFVCKGTPGRCCLVPDPIDFCIAQDMVALRANPVIVDNHYLLAVLRSQEIQNQIINTSVGDVIPHFKKRFFDTLMIPVPPMEVQKIIGDYYFTFCEKIEMSTKVSNTLLEQATAIFKKRCASFESVPAGWKESSLTGIANYLNGLAMQKFRPQAGEDALPVLKIRELRQGNVDQNSDECSANINVEYIVNDGDVIFSWSGSLLVDFWCGGKCGLNQHLFKVTSQKFDKWFYYAWTDFYLRRFVAIAADKATTMGHIKRGDLQKAKVLIPSEAEYEELGAILRPMYDSVIENRIDNRRLEALRDTVLPKIMSGKVSVEDE